MRFGTTIALTAAAALAAACGGAPSPNPQHAPRQVVELARFEAFDGPTRVGVVRQLEIRDPKGPLPYWRIEDGEGRWIGHATPQGRFSRRVPFQDDEEDLGLWSLPRGVGLLLDASGPVDLRPVPVEADARKR